MDVLVKENKKAYFRFTKDYLIRIRKALGICGVSYYFTITLIDKILSATDDIVVDVSDSKLIEILEALIFSIDLSVKDDYYESISGIYYDELKNALKDYREIRGIVTKSKEYGSYILSDKWVNNAVLNGENHILEQNIDKMLRLIEVISLILKKKDLERAKIKVLDSLSYIVDQKKILECEQNYNALLEQYPKDLIRIENYLRDLQKIILDDWRIGTTKLEDYKPGDKFRFVGHSTDQERINGEFSSRLVSCSLFTEEFTDTYRSGVGFLFEPINIIGADGEDMYVDNYSVYDEEIMNSTSIPPIASIDKVLSKLRYNKERQKQLGKKGNVYSEVIIEGFNPIGIFCFTVGEKSLSFNYQRALKLQEQFPHLPIIEIDLTLYKNLDELDDDKERLIFEVEKSLNPRAQTRDKYYYDLYNLFWEKYLEMKKNKEYKEDDIVKLYQLNDYLIGLRLDVKDLFSGKYNLKEIRFSLLNNPIFGLNRIFYGAFTSYDLECLRNELIEYINEPVIEEAVPGLSEMIRLLAITNLTKEQLLAIRNKEQITIECINEVLRYNINNRLGILKEESDGLKDQKTSLESSLEDKEILLSEQLEYRKVLNHEAFYTLVNYDYSDIQGKLELAKGEQSRLQSEYEAESHLFDEKKELQRKLSQHRIKNFFQLRKLSLELSDFSTKVSRILVMKETYDKAIKNLNQELSFVYQSFKEQTNIEFLTYPDALSRAKDNYSCVDESMLQCEIETIKEQIRAIETKLALLANETNELEEIKQNRR